MQVMFGDIVKNKKNNQKSIVRNLRSDYDEKEEKLHLFEYLHTLISLIISTAIVHPNTGIKTYQMSFQVRNNWILSIRCDH